MILMEALRACSGRSRRQAIIASCSVGKSVEIALGCRVEGPRRVSDLCRSNYRQGRVFLNEWGTTIQRKHHCTSSEEAANDCHRASSTRAPNAGTCDRVESGRKTRLTIASRGDFRCYQANIGTANDRASRYRANGRSKIAVRTANGNLSAANSDAQLAK